MTEFACNKSVASVASNRLLSKVLQVCKHFAGSLLKAIRSITKLVIIEQGDFGEGLLCTHSESYFYEVCYQFIDGPYNFEY